MLPWGMATNSPTEQRMTARTAILRAYAQLEQSTGRQAFSAAEIADLVPEYSRRTITGHLYSYMAEGKHHAVSFGEIERVSRGLYQLTAKGRTSMRELRR